MANGTMLLVGFFVVASRLLMIGVAGAPAPFFWYGDQYYDDSSSSEEDDNVKYVYVYVNVTSPGSNLCQGCSPTSMPVNIPLMVQVTPTVTPAGGNANGATPAGGNANGVPPAGGNANGVTPGNAGDTPAPPMDSSMG
ncbi:uncharacterized protein LOC114329576 [Diabrotica virgifera virgifera]|uniref:Uncharacterized protein LOC114329576 n=1 Tax=Diabrotica virgifera virgifera TaxID=50390 RepID=A0A6P7FHU9_DIAVI|nr:uncharacterized protein LOC114329576 [Diabrotica virgifera virgifera]